MSFWEGFKRGSGEETGRTVLIFGRWAVAGIVLCVAVWYAYGVARTTFWTPVTASGKAIEKVTDGAKDAFKTTTKKVGEAYDYASETVKDASDRTKVVVGAGKEKVRGYWERTWDYVWPRNANPRKRPLRHLSLKRSSDPAY